MGVEHSSKLAQQLVPACMSMLSGFERHLCAVAVQQPGVVAQLQPLVLRPIVRLLEVMAAPNATACIATQAPSLLGMLSLPHHFACNNPACANLSIVQGKRAGGRSGLHLRWLPHGALLQRCVPGGALGAAQARVPAPAAGVGAARGGHSSGGGRRRRSQLSLCNGSASASESGWGC